jgi:outer membrane receptor protein involved in Fe transport
MSRDKRRAPRVSSANWVRLPLASAILASLSPVSHADQADSDSMLQEVTVTAQKRTEDLQKVPISIQVLGSETLEQHQVGSFDDYAKLLPSVSYQSFGPGQAQLYFRGIASGGDGLHAGSEPATGMYLDEIPITTIGNTPDLHIYDIQRVEALAGPQGTLYGANSLSGTLRVITNKPDPTKFESGYDMKGDKYGRGGAGGEFEGFVNIPVAENAAVRLVGYYDHDGGYISNVSGTRTYTRQSTDPATYPDDPLTISDSAYAKRNFNAVDTYGGRAALKIDLNDNWTVSPIIVYQHEKAPGTFAYDPHVGFLDVQDYTPDSTVDQWYQSALTVEGKWSDYDLVYTAGYFDRNEVVVSDYSEYSLAYDYYGYSRFRNNAGQLIDPTQNQVQRDRYTKLSQEVRLSSPVTDRFRYTVGAFYQRQTDNIRDEYLLQDLGNSPAYDFSVTGQNNTLYLTQQTRVDRDYAVFGDATFDVTSQFKVSAGIRGFVARNTLYGFFGFNDNYVDENNGDNFAHASGESSCVNAPATGANLPCVNTNKGIRESGETHRVNLTYQIDPDRMVYATYSTGFRPGGNNRRVGLAPYRDDTLTNFEFGYKTSWLDGRLRANGAVFYERWKDVQLGVAGPNAITDIFNIGNAAVKGTELEIDWVLFQGFTLSASGTYVNARTTTDFCGEDLSAADKGTSAYGQLYPSCPGTASSPAGARLPVTPELKANATARYQFNTDGYKNFLQATVLHQSSAASILDTASEAILGPTPAFTTADFAVGTAQGNWNAELYIENAFDEHGQLNRYGQCSATFCYENPRVYPIKPQNFGIKFAQRF